MSHRLHRSRAALFTALLLAAAGCSSTAGGAAASGGISGGTVHTEASAPSTADFGTGSVAADGDTDDGPVAPTALADALSSASSLASPATTADGGTATVTVDGETSTVSLDPCVIIDTTDVNLALYSPGSGLDIMLPPQPGPFGEDELGRVLLPPPSNQDEYRPASHLTGQWARQGDGATGHIEGIAHLLSGITSDEDPEFPFTIDFECTSLDYLTAE